MPEGKPTTKPADEDAAHFLLRMVHKFPHQVTIYEGGPMTNLALAIALDPDLRAWRKNWCSWAGVESHGPTTGVCEHPRREFNLWFDPEAAHEALMAPWKKIVCTTVDISVKTR